MLLLKLYVIINFITFYSLLVTDVGLQYLNLWIAAEIIFATRVIIGDYLFMNMKKTYSQKRIMDVQNP